MNYNEQMLFIGSKINRRVTLVSFAIILFLFALFPGKGGLEGDQRDIVGMSNRVDNWGFIVPFAVGNWPNFFGFWRFSLAALQLILFWIGLRLLLKESWSNLSGLSRVGFALFILISSTFVSQLWRDSTLLALATFGLGLSSRALVMRGFYKWILIISSIMILHLSGMFKVLYGILLGVFFVWLLIQSGVTSRKWTVSAIFICVSLTVSPFLIDKQLTNYAGMKKVFPEQQPIIFDLTSSYCWGTSNSLVADAAKGLELVKQPGFPLESVCASLRPTSWDNLHASQSNWKFSSPVERITGDGDKKVASLRNHWISMIVRNPVDWGQVRLMYLGWTLTLSNSFVPQNESNTWDGIIGSVNKASWGTIYAIASVADKFRFTSILFALLTMLLLTVNSAFESTGDWNRFKHLARDPVIGMLVLLITTAITIFGFVASNGRYVLPYVVLVYVFTIRSKTLRYTSKCLS